MPVYVANDSQVAALAEHVFGDARVSNLVAIKVGQGIGAGLVLNGELFSGRHRRSLPPAVGHRSIGQASQIRRDQSPHGLGVD